MVFSSVSQAEAPKPSTKATNSTARPPPMPPSSVSTKSLSHPLHNFHLSDLKWATSHTNSHRVRKTFERSPLREGRHETEANSGNPAIEPPSRLVSGSFSELKDRPEDPCASATLGSADPVSLLESTETELDERSKILIRIKSPESAPGGAVASGDACAVGDPISRSMDAEECVLKTWNLRPRKSMAKRPREGGGPAIGENIAHGANRVGSTPPRNGADAKTTAADKRKMPKFSISLAKAEIEEDIFAISGSKPSRRPRKRAKNVQKQLDNVFPGLWLGSITPDCYKVFENPKKDLPFPKRPDRGETNGPLFSRSCLLIRAG